MLRSGWFGGMLVAAAVVALVTGCSKGDGAGTVGPTEPGSPTSTPSVVAYPMPDLGPSPAPVSLSDDEMERLRLEQQDQLWSGVIAQYPEAVRPQVTFDEYVTEADHVAVMSACLEAAGVTVDLGRDSQGNIGGVGFSAATEAQAVGAYACQAAHPTTPVPPPSPAQVGYIYDYLTEFLAPCYAANGIPSPPAPPREEFIANWPMPGWMPSLGDAQGTPLEEAIDEVCPPTA